LEAENSCHKNKHSQAKTIPAFLFFNIEKVTEEKGGTYYAPPEKHEDHANTHTCNFETNDIITCLLKEEIPGHKKEFPVTEQNCSRKKEIYLKGKTGRNISCDNNTIMLPRTSFH
jgi:hypothetical protein